MDAKRRTKKIGKLRGTVRQLYQNGQFEEGESLLAAAIPHLTHDNIEPDVEFSESEPSTGS